MPKGIIKRFTELIGPVISAKKFWLLFFLIFFYEIYVNIMAAIPSAMAYLIEKEVTQIVWNVFFGIVLFIGLFWVYFDTRLDHFITKLTYPVYTYLKQMVVTKLSQMPESWHQEHKSAAWIGSAQKGAEKVSDFLDILFWDMIPTALQFVVNLGPMLLLHLLTAVFLSIGFCISIVINLYYYKVMRPIKEERHDIYPLEFADASLIIEAQSTLKAFNQVENFISRMYDKLKRIEILGIIESRIARYQQNSKRLGSNTVIKVAIQIFWVYLLARGEMSFPVFLYLNTQTERLISAFHRVARLIEKVIEHVQSIEKVSEIYHLEAPEEPNLNPPPTGGDIIFENVTFSYPNTQANGGGPNIENFNLTIKRGEVIAFVGPSGAGKTTITGLFTRIWQPTSGKITIDDVDINTYPKRHHNDIIATVPQGDSVFIIPGTIAENVALGKPEATEDAIREALELAGLLDFVDSQKDGIHTEVGMRGIKLSGGQKQRLAIARAILYDKEILIFDEATSAVDPKTEQYIQENLERICKDRTVFIIAHRLSTIAHADKIVVLQNGRIIEEGDHKALMALNGHYAHNVKLNRQHE